MGEVVYVDFKRTRSNTSVPDEMLDRFTAILRRKGLAEDDIQDVLEGIADYRHYLTLDKDLKYIVEVWFQHMGEVK